jgi:hypothetical protein
MRIVIVLMTSGVLTTILSGCQFGGSSGVFEHSTVPPPPSVSAELKSPAKPDRKPVATPARRSQAEVVDRPVEAATPSEPVVQPVMTGSGMGAGFRF